VPEPVYSEQAAKIVERLEAEGGPLLDAACDAIDLVCDHGERDRARRRSLRGADGTHYWVTDVRTRTDSWILAWYPLDADEVAIAYLGPDTFQL
jgi:hypothetical protein